MILNEGNANFVLQIKFNGMKLQNRIELLKQLKEYLNENDAGWQETKQKASVANGWFTPEFIELSIKNIVEYFLDEVF